MTLITAIIIVLAATPLSGQHNCDCADDLRYLIDFFEENLPAYDDQVDTTNRKTYNSLKAQLIVEAERVPDDVACFKTLTLYVEYFKDHHTVLYSQSDALDRHDPVSVQRVTQRRRKHPLPSPVTVDTDLATLPGTYTDAAATLELVILPLSATDFVGVITASQDSLWTVGDVKFEIYASGDTLQVFEYDDDNAISYYDRYELNNGVFADSWYDTVLGTQYNPVVNVPDSLTFRMINDSTGYVYIPSFFVSASKAIREFHQIHDAAMSGAKYLIIDIRNNGGGSEQNAMPFLKYFYTGPVPKDQVGIYVTPGNIMKYEKLYAELAADTANANPGLLNWAQNEITAMKEAPMGTYLSRSSTTDSIRIKVESPTPEKVIVLYNKYTASSAESFIFWAKYSDKATLVGENSGGYLGYGEAIRLETPCLGFGFRTTMTRYAVKRKYDGIGVPPDVQLRYDQDWVRQTVGLF